MGMIRVGGNYQGMTVMHVMSAQDFLRKIVFTQYHPGVNQVKVLDSSQLPKLAEAYHQASSKTIRNPGPFPALQRRPHAGCLYRK